MYKLKQLPEDFVVIELPVVKAEPRGKYLYFWMKKKEKNTLDAVKELAKMLWIKEKDIGFAGSKDKHAVTEQMISFTGITKEMVENLNIKQVLLQFYGYGKTPISLGDLQGNEFEITVRNLTKEKIEEITLVENYFDEQRFSTQNVEIGRHLLKKEFAEAVSLIDEEKVKSYLDQKPKDYVGALKILPSRLLRMYVNAYQSYLWNKTVAAYLEQKGNVLKKVKYSGGEVVFVSDLAKCKDLKVPLIGFGHEEVEDEEIQEIIDKIMEEERLSYADFIIKQIPALTLEGELRKVVIPVHDLEIGRKAKDELNPGKKKVEISFTLPKGSYATLVIKRIIS
ncbi:MAG: tRNA pseudouridine(13) synthase TruD [Nanoarchaeota archaeon]|nr:tRNA pseudouridine(13) synthase TruD [Nanoarchaeota archaeon]